jgi:hypothetical protein
MLDVWHDGAMALEHTRTPITDFRKQAFLEWLCTVPKERDPRTEELFGNKIGVTRRTLSEWKNDKEFLEAWEKKYLRTIGDPGRKAQIMSTLLKTATDPDDPKHVQAAKAYFEIEGSMKPAKMEVSVTRPASELTDAELEVLLAEHAKAEMDQRKDSA